MFIQTWLLPLALMATATLVAFPLSRYMTWIMDGKYRPLPVLRWFEKRTGQRPAELEAVYRLPARFQHRAVRLRLCGAGASAVDAAQSGRQGDAAPQHHLSQRHLVHDEHRPPALFRRAALYRIFSQIFFASPIFSCRRRSAYAPCPRSSGLCAAIPRGQLLPGHVAGGGLHVRARRLCRRPRVSGARQPHDLTEPRSRSRPSSLRLWEPRTRARRSRRTIVVGRWRPLSPSRCWGPTAADISG